MLAHHSRLGRRTTPSFVRAVMSSVTNAVLVEFDEELERVSRHHCRSLQPRPRSGRWHSESTRVSGQAKNFSCQ